MPESSKTSATGFFKYFKGFIGGRIYVYILLNFLIGIFDGLGLAMFIPLIYIATGSQNESGQSLGNLKFLVDFIDKTGFEFNIFGALGLMVILFIIKGIFYFIKINYLNRTVLIAQKNIRYRLVDGLKKISYEGFTKSDAGRIQNNMVGEVGKLVGAMNHYFAALQNTIMMLTYIMMAFFSNWKFAIMVAIGGLLTNVFYKYINKITKVYALKLSSMGHNFNAYLIETIQNFKYLKATNYFKIFENRLKNNIEESEDIAYKVGRVGSIGESLREPLIIIVIAVVIYVQIAVLKNDFGSILASLILFYRALAYLVSMQNSWSNYIRNSAGLESVESLLSEFNTLKEYQGSEKISHIGNIAAKDISVSYDNRTILSHIDLEIRKKTSIAFVGESGAGKTTLANVICGLLRPHSGKIYSDQISVYDADITSFRNKVGYITQEPVIFDDSIFNNVTFWAKRNEENLKKFREVIRMVSLEKFVENLEQKENAPLGNNGILISGGQKQRISIARELYKDTELLIMDEATSALDSETEKFIKENIDLLHGKFTMIIIAHRLSTIQNVDRIYLMSNGKIVDSGNFNNLLQSSEHFRKMVELQKLT